jgi:hypothetical protein
LGDVQALAAGDSLIGETLGGKYRVLQQIGRGGMGVVYEAEHLGLGKRVAIKLMLEKYTGDTEAVARFHREAFAAGRIGNPHIIEIFDMGKAPDGRSFVVMELLSGFPLAKVLEMSGALPPWRAVQIMRQVLRAVEAAHAKGIIHRDLKPDNIFLIRQGDDQDFVKLLDFGISKVLNVEEQVAITTLTTTGVVMGTPLYMAPEQALGNRVDRHADIYACGVILYEMLAGRPPFDGPTYAALVGKLLTAAPPPLGELRPGLPASLVRAVHRALEKEPGDRFDSAEQFAAALPGNATPSGFELAGTLDGGASAAVSVPRRSGRFRNVMIAASAFTLAAAATAVVLVVTDDEEAAPASAAQVAPGAEAAQVRTDEAEPKERTAPRRPPPVGTGTLDVKTVPSGAAVIVDGHAAGTAPIEVRLEVGRHQVRLELAGHAAVTADADVRANAQTSVVVPLGAAAVVPAAPAAKAGRPSAVGAQKAKPSRPAAVEAPRQKPAQAPAAAATAPAPTPPTPTPPPTPPPAVEAPRSKPAPADDPKRPAQSTKPNPYK